MSDRFHPLTLEHLTEWTADELAAKNSVFGIPRPLFFTPRDTDSFRTEVYARSLETPLGVAAGPHSQLSQNIVTAWLCGARFIELKTVQTLDQLEISKPCIDMQDVGYNVEWSQELLVRQSYLEYLHAWVLIHALHRHLGFPGDHPGVIFNVSVGYDLKGIHQPNMQWYLDTIADAGEDLDRCLNIVSARFPELRDIEVPRQISDNVTLSTMHGCPPEEIGSISEYLLRVRGLHTSVKLNPTLLGPALAREILNKRLGFRDITIPDQAFEHDLRYADALALIDGLQTTAAEEGLQFGVKLTNTLEVENERHVFEKSEETMYLSGRPLHALTTALALQLSEDVDSELLFSFSGGADANNVAPLLRSGMRTITVCSDLLRPGGYLRLRQYLDTISAEMAASASPRIEEFIRTGSPECASVHDAARSNLRKYAEATLPDPAYHAETFNRAHTKTKRRLGLFDCIVAPCVDACDVDQKVPEYMRMVGLDDLDGAAAVMREDNPLASILGRTCHHPCEPVCLRTHMDQPLAIREIKRYITDHEQPPTSVGHPAASGDPVAIVGGGPCGLAAATFLARAGRPVTIFEARENTGGMVSATIPDYRAASQAVQRDLQRVEALGVEIRYNQEVGGSVTLSTLRKEGFASIVIAVGARRGTRLGIEGEDSDGVFDGLDFLRAARSGRPPALGKRIGIIGGGDVAMDCARTALRLSNGRATVYYRRTRLEMPAHEEEIRDLLLEGGYLEELAAPQRVLSKNGRIDAVEMIRMRLGEPDASGRRRPQAVAGSEALVRLDSLIVAIGQRPDLSLFGGDEVDLTNKGYVSVDSQTLETSLEGVYAGGDIIGDGPSNIVRAAGDGRRIATAILNAGKRSPSEEIPAWPPFDRTVFLDRRARTEARIEVPHLAPGKRVGFAEVVQTLSDEAARREASRCLDCDLLCSTCEGVCPNRAILTYAALQGTLHLPNLNFVDGNLKAGAPMAYSVKQGPQVAVLTDACNECGNCVTFCPTADRPWRDKPRFYLNREDFEAQKDNAFMLLNIDGSSAIQARFEGETHQLVEGEQLLYTSPKLDLTMKPENFEIVHAEATNTGGDPEIFGPSHLGTMITLLRSFTTSMPEFPVVVAAENWVLPLRKHRAENPKSEIRNPKSVDFAG